MLSIQSLFDVTADEYHTIHKKHRKRLNRKCKYIKNYKEYLPNLAFPSPNSKQFQEDLESVKFYYSNSSLSSNFLDFSNNSVEACFKEFCNELNVTPDWKEISKLLDDVDSIVLKLKYAHGRPRPKYYLLDESSLYNAVKDNKSPSFPSGHTTIAFFISGVLSNEFPDYRQDFEMLAELVGQSRIENGVHFPTDVSSGKLVGEVLYNCYSDKNSADLSFEKVKKSDSKNFAKFLQKRADNIDNSIRSLAHYLYLTNKIEQVEIPWSECVNSSRKIHEGYPCEYVSQNLNIHSIIKPLLYSFKIGNLDSVQKILTLHKLMPEKTINRGVPGSFRNFEHFSPSGHRYHDHLDIKGALETLCSENYKDPFLNHATFEHIHPFPDGNGRIGRVILCNHLDYNFSKCNEIMGKDYIKNLNLYFRDF